MEATPVNTTPKEINLTDIVVCLFDGDYHLGCAALVNSLVKSNFKGLITVGYRGDLPEWVSQLELITPDLFFVTKEVIIQFTKVDTNMHLGYYKPFFIKQIFDQHTATNKVYYFDADITVKASWAFYSNWLQKGVCLCLDNSFHFLHKNHPWRKDWKKLAPENVIDFNETDCYFNSGFLGIERESISLLDRWIHFTQKFNEMGGNIYLFDKYDYNSVKSDQDLLNAAITISPDIEMSIIGTEGMGFTLPAAIMAHAVGDYKPWNNSFLKQLIKSGHKPTLSDKRFFANCEHPIRIFSGYKHKVKKLDLFIASFCGRILG